MAGCSYPVQPKESVYPMSNTNQAVCCEASDVACEDNLEAEVRRRYAGGAREVEAELCCPITDYQGEYLKILPEEIIEKDYGCGDPSKWINSGETVVDLGSGAGKICYILAQKVGAEGRVIGVDFNDVMLNLAGKYQDEIARIIGYANTSFVKAKIQDLALDLGKMQSWIEQNPLKSVEDLAAWEAECDRLRGHEPLIPDDSVDAVVSNCVLNLVRPEDKLKLFDEIFRVLNRGGRAVISDIVCDENTTPAILDDPGLWSGCIAGAFREDEFIAMFERAGFHGIEILARQDEPWRVIDGVEFRSLTVRAWKGKQGPCFERNQAVVYRGPWKSVFDDDNHKIVRGRRMAVCDKTYRILTDPDGPYADHFFAIEPHEDIPLEDAMIMDCKREEYRDPRETKGQEYRLTTDAPDCCSSDDCC
jgi:arsenite methyltransferase